jgi:AbrB family looped-hinge helix DNA binding protein
MSSKGQIVIPEDIRKEMGLRTGTQFLVVGGGDVVILKEITPPSMADFDDLVAEARRQARKAGMKRSDIKSAISTVRKRK